MKKKLIIDIMLFILMLLEFQRGYMPTILHEIIGIILLLLVIIHLLLNRTYIKSIAKGKYNLKRIMMLIINILFMISFGLSIVLGVLSSQDLLTFLNVGNMNIISFHKIFAYISLLCMGMHLGINFNFMFGKLLKIINNNIILYMISIIIIMFGIYSWIDLDFWKHLIGNYGFVMKTGNVVINIIKYLSIIMMIVIIVNYLYKKLDRKGEENER